MNKAYDCHLHVIDPVRFPYPGGPGYQPRDDEQGDARALTEVFRAHEIAGALLVQPSTYGTDNRCMLDAMAAADGAYRGIAVVDPTIEDRELDRLQQAGVLGIRLNVGQLGPSIVEAATPLLPRIIERGWFIQLHMPAPMLADHIALFRQPLRTGDDARLIFDHCGHPAIEHGLDEPGFQEVLRCGSEGLALVKLSGAFRLSDEPFPHADLDPFAVALLDAFGPERCVFGSDWPFFGDIKPGYASTLAMIERWVPTPDTRRQILLDNPKRYFGLTAAAA